MMKVNKQEQISLLESCQSERDKIKAHLQGLDDAKERAVARLNYVSGMIDAINRLTVKKAEAPKAAKPRVSGKHLPIS